MTAILRKKSLRAVITIILMLCMCLPSLKVEAKADEKSLAEIMDEIAYMGLIKGENEEQGRHITAHYYISQSVDLNGKEFGMLIFPRLYMEKFNVYDDYAAKFTAQGKTYIDVVATNYYTLAGGKMYRVGISRVREQNANIEFCFVPYLKEGEERVYGTRHFGSYNGLDEITEPTFLAFTEYESDSDGKSITMTNFLPFGYDGKSIRTYAISESSLTEHGIDINGEESLKNAVCIAENELSAWSKTVTTGTLYAAACKHITNTEEKYYFIACLSGNGEDEFLYCKSTTYKGVSKNNATASAGNGIDPRLGTSTEESLQIIITKLKKLVNSVWAYVVTAFAAVTVVWGSVIGIKIAIAKRRDEKINARGMIKSLVIGIIVMAVIAVGAPLIITGLSVWAA